MRRQTRFNIESCSCLDLLFLAQIRTSLEHAAPGKQTETHTQNGPVSVLRVTDGYVITTGGTRTLSLKLTTTLTGFGVRYWYCCPWCARRCAVLYIRDQTVACRECIGL